MTARHPSTRIHTALRCLLAAATLLPVANATCQDTQTTHRKVLQTANPEYPPIARQMRLEGTLSLIVTVLPTGVVETVKLQSGHPLLFRAAEDAVRQWRFAPAHDTTVTAVNVTFVLK